MAGRSGSGGDVKIDWEGILQAHGDVVWRTVYRIVGRDADAADCFQETFIAAMKLAGRQDIRNWGGLLRRLATQRAIDSLRRRKTDVLRQPLDDAAAASGAADALRVVLNGELGGRLKTALAILPGAQAEIFCLRHLSEMSYEEISRETGLSVDAVGVTLHRAKSRLRKLMEPYAALNPVAADRQGDS